MSTNKRSCATSSDCNASKQNKTAEADNNDVLAAIEEFRSELEPVLTELESVELKIAKEQTKVLKKFKEELNAIYVKRDALIEKQDALWGKLISIHPAISEQNLMVSNELSYIVPYLKKCRLNEFIDDNGSYTLEFHFFDGAKSLFEPLVWTKTVIFNDDQTVNQEKSTCTEIKFNESQNDPRETIKEYLESEENNSDFEHWFSIAGWFSTVDPEQAGPFGDVFRTEIYPHPEDLLNEEDSDDSEDQYDDNEDSDEDDDESDE